MSVGPEKLRMIHFKDESSMINFIKTQVNKLLSNLKKDKIDEEQKNNIITVLYVLHNNFENPCGVDLSNYDILYGLYNNIINGYNEIITKSSITENDCICLLALLYFLMYIITPLKYCGTGTDKGCNYSRTFTFNVNTSFRFDLILSNTLKILTKDELSEINDKIYVITLIMFILSNINKRITDLDKYRNNHKQFYYDNIRLYYYIFDSLLKLIGRQNCYCYPGWKNLIDYFNKNVFHFDLLIYINSRPETEPRIVNPNFESEEPINEEYVRARGCIITDRHIYITDTKSTENDEISTIGQFEALKYDTEEEKEKEAEEKEATEPIESPAEKKPRKYEPLITGGLNAYYKYLTYKYEKYFK